MVHALHVLAPVLLTGATGMIGGELLRSLLHSGYRNVSALVRPRDGLDAESRLNERLRRSGIEPEYLSERAEAVAGDMRSPGLGLSASTAERLQQDVEFIIHSASETSFIRSRECEQTNIEGTRRLIEFARGCRRQPLLVYISTAANGGALTHRCLREEEGCRVDAPHHNGYTHSKAIAERMVVESGLPALILRPSIVFSAGLPDPDFARAILWFVPLLNAFDSVPIDPVSRLDAVPVSYVVDSTLALMRLSHRRFGCYHISAGRNSMTCGDIIRFLDGFYERTRPLKPVAATAWTRELHRRYVNTPERRKMFGMLRHYLPFLNMDVVYDNSRLATDLGPDAVNPVPFTSYMGQLLEMIPEEAAMAEALNP